MTAYGRQLEKSRKLYQSIRDFIKDAEEVKIYLEDPWNSMDFVRFLPPKHLSKIDRSKEKIREILSRLKEIEKAGSSDSLRCCFEQLKLSLLFIRISFFARRTNDRVCEEMERQE